MKKLAYLSIGSLAIAATVLFTIKSENSENEKSFVQHTPELEEGKSLEPHDQWMTIRSYPDGFNQEMYLERMKQIKLEATYAADSREVELGLDWQQEGPGNIGGRIDVLTVSPTDNDIIYAGATNGGIFKTTDGGASWNPIFDDQPFLAIGAITIDPDNENIVYAGTGDRNFTGSSFIGNGVYKSEDAGATWTNIGLEETGVVTEFIIDPTDTDRLFVSTLGNPHVKTTDRGVYRSDDGGATWSNKLFVTDSSGIIDLIMSPGDPNTLYAAGYNRMRNYYGSTVTGPQAKIYKTTNGGDSWTELSAGLPADEECRIGLAISNDNPDVVYALYVDGSSLDVQDIYKSTNAGTTWAAMDVHDGAGGLPDVVMGGFGWYFGEVYLNPYDNDQLVIPGVEMYQTLDGGETWSQNVPDWWTYEVHADKHAIAFLDENSYIIATDGGLYRTDNNGGSWTDIDNIPITQFYHIDVDPINPGRYGGGAQDNGSMSGNMSVFNEWDRLFGGDGFRVTFLEEDEGAAYYETQNGGLRYADPFGSTTNLSPDDDFPDRTNWDMPYFINESVEELFVGTAHVQYMQDAPFGSYEYISEDLTRVGLGDYEGAERYHTITEMDQPFHAVDLLYVGTSDGLVWRGERMGGDFDWEWDNITGSLPNRYVTGVRCSPNELQTTYVCLSGYKEDEDESYLYKKTASGEWEDISGNLPGITVNDILIVPGYEDDSHLFAALDGGVYFSSNGGDFWDYLGIGMPIITVSELHLDTENERLIAGTYSRSMWSYDISWLEAEVIDDVGINDNQLTEPITVYPNPANELVYFNTTVLNSIVVYDVNGRYIADLPVQHLNGYSQINVSKLKTGIYSFRLENGSGTIVKI